MLTVDPFVLPAFEAGQPTYDATLNAVSMICCCSIRWLLAEPVAGLAEAGREMRENGSLPASFSPK
jgi:hypothetical protein